MPRLWRRKTKPLPDFSHQASPERQKNTSNRAIAREVQAALAATEDHSLLALNVAVLAREHAERFGEKPQLLNLVAVDGGWPVVLVARAVGTARVVTRYIITDEGDVSLERNYSKMNPPAIADTNVITTVPLGL